VKVSVNSKVRRRLPDWVEIVSGGVASTAVYYGIPCQSLVDAKIVCRATVPRYRLKKAIGEVEKMGLLFGPELKTVRKGIASALGTFTER